MNQPPTAASESAPPSIAPEASNALYPGSALELRRKLAEAGGEGGGREDETLRLLITDDEPILRSGVTRMLEKVRLDVPDVGLCVRFEIDQAESGSEALKKIAAKPPDILLLDQKMPGMSGVDVLDWLVAKQSPVLTIMVSAYASVDTVVAATKRGAFDFLAKPFTPDELKAAIRKAAARIILVRKARESEEARRQVRFEFIRVLGHELKSPLAAIEGYLQIMRDRVLGDGVAAYDDIIARSQARVGGMRKLIRDLLDMTRIESGQKVRELARHNLRDVLDGLVELYAERAAARDIAIHLACHPQLGILADRGELDMMIGNLISNAVKYNRDGGRIDVTAKKNGDMFEIDVQDTGIGMTEAEAAKLFGEFVRIRNSKTQNILGSGLGLSIVRKLAEMYAGDVSVTSEPGVGSVFHLRLKEPATPAMPT